MSKEYEIDFERILREVAEKINIEEGIFDTDIEDMPANLARRRQEKVATKERRKAAAAAIAAERKRFKKQDKEAKEKAKDERKELKYIQNDENRKHKEDLQRQKLEAEGEKFVARADKLFPKNEEEAEQDLGNNAEEKNIETPQQTQTEPQQVQQDQQNKNQNEQGGRGDPEELVKQYGQYYNYNIKSINAVLRDVLRYSKRWVGWYEQRGLSKFANNLEGLMNLINSVNTGVEKVYYNPQYGDVNQLGDEFEKIGNLEVPKTNNAQSRETNVEQSPTAPQVQNNSEQVATQSEEQPQQAQTEPIEQSEEVKAFEQGETPPEPPQIPANVQDVTNDAERVDSRIFGNPNNVAPVSASPRRRQKLAIPQQQTQTPIEQPVEQPAENETSNNGQEQLQEDQETIQASQALNERGKITKKIGVVKSLLNDENASKIGNTSAENIIRFFSEVHVVSKNKDMLANLFREFIENSNYNYSIDEGGLNIAGKAAKKFGLDKDINFMEKLTARKREEEIISESLRSSIELANYIRKAIRKMV